jgi:predicted nucleic acid-binding protein
VTGALVVDASTVVQVALGTGPATALAQRLATADCFAPELLDIEVPDLPVARVSHRALSPRIWELRDSLTAYDAAYVALAERLDAPLVTCDAKLAAAHGHAVEIELHPN